MLGPTHPTVAGTLNSKAVLLQNQVRKVFVRGWFAVVVVVVAVVVVLVLTEESTGGVLRIG